MTRYRSLFVVGRGGMGSVEAALEQGASAERVVALKRLLPDAARDRKRVDMFLREAKLAAMLDHPNVVTAYDYGEIDGELYLAMEYVEGQPLSRVLRALDEAKESLPIDVVAHLLAEIGRGLHAAHELADPGTGQALQLVHRDVSPQNVMLSYDGRVRLLDFGVAKIDTESVTKTGEVKGKTAYMSPEQAMGDPLDRRSDLFGVGAVLFECLALRRMWGDGTDMEVIRKLALERPPKLDATGRDDVPDGLSKLYERLVAHERDDRPATALDVATALDAFVPDAARARAKLEALLDGHFASHAKEQRQKLDVSLGEAAPARAEALRESLHPPSRPPSVVEVARAEAASNTRTKVVLAAVLALVGGATVLWRASATEPSRAQPLAVEAQPSVATTREDAIAPSTSASAALASHETTIARPGPSVVAPAVAPAKPTAPSTAGSVRAAPSAPKPAPSLRPAPSAKRPAIDEDPF